MRFGRFLHFWYFYKLGRLFLALWTPRWAIRKHKRLSSCNQEIIFVVMFIPEPTFRCDSFGRTTIKSKTIIFDSFLKIWLHRPMKYKQCALIGEAFDGVWQTLATNSRQTDKRLTNPGNLARAWRSFSCASKVLANKLIIRWAQMYVSQPREIVVAWIYPILAEISFFALYVCILS